MTFLTIQSRTEYDGRDTNVLLLNFWQWLTNNSQISKKKTAMGRPTLNEGGHASAFKGFSFFSSVKHLDKSSQTRGTWEILPFFDTLRQQIELKLEETGFISEPVKSFV